MRRFSVHQMGVIAVALLATGCTGPLPKASEAISTPSPGVTSSTATTPGPLATATPGAPPSAGPPILRLTIAQPGTVARQTFTGSTGQRIFVDVPSSDLPDECGILSLEGPDGSRLASGCIIGGNGFIDGTLLVASGTYTITVTPTKGTGSVQLQVIASTDQQGPIRIDGPAVTAVIPVFGAVTHFTFQGTTGQKVFVDIPSSNINDECGLLSLLAPDGSRLGSGCIIGGSGFIDATPLPATGEYAIVIDPGARGIGSAQVRLIAAIDQDGTIRVDGDAVTATIAQFGAVARFTFPGTAGQKVSLDVPSSTLADECGILAILAPDGNRLASGCIIGGKGSIDATVLPTTGQYTIVVDPAARGTGTAQLRLH